MFSAEEAAVATKQKKIFVLNDAAPDVHTLRATMREVEATVGGCARSKAERELLMTLPRSCSAA